MRVSLMRKQTRRVGAHRVPHYAHTSNSSSFPRATFSLDRVLPPLKYFHYPPYPRRGAVIAQVLWYRGRFNMGTASSWPQTSANFKSFVFFILSFASFFFPFSFFFLWCVDVMQIERQGFALRNCKELVF